MSIQDVQINNKEKTILQTIFPQTNVGWLFICMKTDRFVNVSEKNIR